MILIVEDDLGIQETLKDLLMMKGYQVQQAYTIKDVLKKELKSFELIIIDIQLPDGNGVTLCQQIRQISQVPILFLTARNDEETIVEALNAGGDDYITKPFRANELLARMQSISRRVIKNKEIIETDDLVIDMKKYQIFKNNEEIVLSAIGYEILFLMVQNQGIVVTRERLIEFIEERTGNYIEDNTVTVHMKRLREKLGTYQGRDYIETVRGIGYRWKNV
ncbi:response regulator transcription factor [Candidatus Stoquefichus sp. SB1]|uniref:response regulator transcription factor n=1 Tax=Candidatus Stoquefichus sp. SB1 TaxID=1658109 RepID=UPI0009E3B5EB|nr:response regulator transcription factor [Candidatus Stoquefichus sp. SB1]